MNPQFNSVEAQKVLLSSQKACLLARAIKLAPDCNRWELLDTAEYLSALSTRFMQEEESAKSACEEAAQRQKQKVELQEKCEKISSDLATQSHEIEEERETLSSSEKIITALKAETEAIRDLLPYETRKLAEKKQAEMMKEISELNALISAHQDEFTAAKESLDKAKGEYHSKVNSLPEYESAEKRTETRYYSVLNESGFANSDELDAALALIDMKDREDWLVQKQNDINAYYNDCTNTNSRILELKKQTEELQYTNIEELNAKIEQAREARDSVENIYSTQKEILNNHNQVHRLITDAMSNLNMTNKINDMIKDKYPTLTRGIITKGGKGNIRVLRSEGKDKPY